MKYTFFWNGCFSNWHPAEFTYKGHSFKNSEQAFMWEKAMTFEDHETANKILKAESPKDAKYLGRQVKGYNDKIWSELRYDYMFDVCMQKFLQNDRLKEELLSCQNFVEASPYDKIWGIGMCELEDGIEDPKNWKGLNLLGQVLDEVHDSIILYNKKYFLIHLPNGVL